MPERSLTPSTQPHLIQEWLCYINISASESESESDGECEECKRGKLNDSRHREADVIGFILSYYHTVSAAQAGDSLFQEKFMPAAPASLRKSDRSGHNTVDRALPAHYN